MLSVKTMFWVFNATSKAYFVRKKKQYIFFVRVIVTTWALDAQEAKKYYQNTDQNT